MTSAIGSIAGGLLGGAAGGSSGPASVGSYYPNIFQNSQSYMTDLGNQQSNIGTLQGTAAPFALNNFNSATQNPFTSAFQTGAGTAGNAYTNAGNNTIGYGKTVGSQVSPITSYAQQVMQLGLDPQSALYNQQRQQAADTANVTNAGYGLTGPWAAGNTNQATQNFDMNWQNQQLQRAIQALNSGGAADQTAGAIGTLANNLQTTGAGNLYTGAGLPYQTAQGISTNQNLNLNDLITNLGGINNIDAGTMSSLLQYLAQGSGYGLNSNQATGNNTANAASGGMDLGGLLGGAIGGLF